MRGKFQGLMLVSVILLIIGVGSPVDSGVPETSWDSARAGGRLCESLWGGILPDW